MTLREECEKAAEEIIENSIRVDQTGDNCPDFLQLVETEIADAIERVAMAFAERVLRIASPVAMVSPEYRERGINAAISSAERGE